MLVLEVYTLSSLVASSSSLLVLRTVPACPIHSISTIILTSMDEGTLNVQVKTNIDPAKIIALGDEEMDTMVGAGTVRVNRMTVNSDLEL